MIRVVFFDVGDTLVNVAAKAWLPGAKDCLAAAKAESLRLGVLSNTGDLSRAQLAALLPADFDFAEFEPDLVLLSSELGVEKPNIAMFQLAVARAEVDAAACCYCSESLTEVLAAQAAGMRGARLDATRAEFINDLHASKLLA